MDEISVMIPQDVANMQLPAPELVTYYRDLDDRIIWVQGDIDESILESSKCILRWNREDAGIKIEDRIPIRVFINSPGGNLTEAMHFCSIISLSETPVITVNMGMALSGAFMILICGNPGMRYTMPYARAMTHSGSGAIIADFGKAKDQMEDYKSQIVDAKNLTLEKTSITKQKYKSMEDRDWFMSADDMVKFGVVDHIVLSLNEIL